MVFSAKLQETLAGLEEDLGSFFEDKSDEAIGTKEDPSVQPMVIIRKPFL
jgi:hypothetical protein